MKKFVLGILAIMWLSFWNIFAQNILPDSAEIEVKSPIMEWEAANLSITMMRNWSRMTNYDGSIYITIQDENWARLKSNEYKLPNWDIYTFLETDLWFKEFQKWLEIKKEWIFYVQVEDLNDPDEKVLWRQQVTVIKNPTPQWNYHIEVLSPLSESTVTNEKLDILWSIKELPNSKALIYIDSKPAETVDVDSAWMINYSIPNIDLWKHSLKIEVPDMDWTILWTSDKINFSVVEWWNVKIKSVSVEPRDLLMVWDKTKITVFTDEMVEWVNMKLSDRPENDALILTKDWLWEFSYNVYLIATWEVNISLETTTANNSISEIHENIEKFYVLDTPEIYNATFTQDPENQSGTASWDILYWDPVNSYIIKYRWSWNNLSWEAQTENKSFTFKDVPYDTEINLNITPVRKNSLNLTTHWAASETIKFIIRKPNTCWDWICSAWETAESCPEDCWGTAICWNWICELWETAESCPDDCTWTTIIRSSCVAQTVPVRTTKIWDNYYLIRDKAKDITKYVIYSSTSQDIKTRTKIFETKDTSYEYPFDYNAKEDTYMYFWVVWICEDWWEVELSWATKVQVWPAENFFLLLCLTFLIYFWIKLFRETE